MFLLVVAGVSEAIQLRGAGLDCFVAEPVIGPATLGRTRWLLAMTKYPRTEEQEKAVRTP
jgi:hypothetical protein